MWERWFNGLKCNACSKLCVTWWDGLHMQKQQSISFCFQSYCINVIQAESQHFDDRIVTIFRYQTREYTALIRTHIRHLSPDFIHSFTFSKPFILVRDVVDPEPILETLSMKWRHTLYKIPVQHTDIHSQLGQFTVVSPSTGMFFGRWDENI